MKSGIEVKPVGAVAPVEPVTPVVNSTETEQLGQPTGTETPENTQNESVSASEQSEDTQETEQTSGATKHLVTYVGGGNWIDANGNKWAKEAVKGTDIASTREYDDADFQSREDLKFMIGYGAMTVATVTL